jgi:hypothetical protein
VLAAPRCSALWVGWHRAADRGALVVAVFLWRAYPNLLPGAAAGRGRLFGDRSASGEPEHRRFFPHSSSIRIPAVVEPPSSFSPTSGGGAGALAHRAHRSDGNRRFWCAR